MKTSGTILLFLLGFLLLSVKTRKPATQTIGLEEALKLKLVKYSALSNGNYSGESIQFSLTNLTGKPLNITIKNGTYFEPDNPSDQNLILVEDVPLPLIANGKKSILLNGYCMESHDSAPSENQKMTIKKTQNEKLTKLCAYLNSKPEKSDNIQSSVWAITDDEPIAYLDNSNEQSRLLRTEVATITTRENPWYTTSLRRQLGTDRRIETLPVEVKGKIKVQISTTDKIHEIVTNERGEQKYNTPPFGFPRAGEWTYTFTMTVKGWEKGTYTVKVLQNNKQIEEVKFQV